MDANNKSLHSLPESPFFLCIFSRLRRSEPVEENSFRQASGDAYLSRADGTSISLHSVREQITAAFQGDHVDAIRYIPSVQQYAAALDKIPDAPLVTTWRDASCETVTNFRSLQWDRCNMIWNLVVLLAFQSTLAESNSSKAQQPFWYFQAAASLCQALKKQVHELLLDSSSAKRDTQLLSCELSPAFLQVWQDTLLAHAQRAAYEAFLEMQMVQRQPRHFLLAGLAAAAVPLFAAAEASCDKALEDDCLIDGGNHLDAEFHFADLMDMWNQAVRAWGMYLNSMAEYHEALKDQGTSSLKQARLEAAIRFVELAQLFLDQENDRNGLAHNEMCHLDQKLQRALEQMQHGLAQLERQLQGSPYHPYDVPSPSLPDERPPIRLQQTVKLVQIADNSILPTMDQLHLAIISSWDESSSPKNFYFDQEYKFPQAPTGNIQSSSKMTTSMLHHYRQSFLHQLLDLHRELSILVQSKTEGGQQALALVNLPQALTSYHQKQPIAFDESGNADDQRYKLPAHLLSRLTKLQKQTPASEMIFGSRKVEQSHSSSDYLSLLQQQLWELRDAADLARNLIKQMEQQLSEDLSMDQIFRQDPTHAAFVGHDVTEVQRAVRESLSHYSNLLETAQQSDEMLFEQIQLFQTDPRFQLLNFDREQLEKLIQPEVLAVSSTDENPGHEQERTVEILSRHLVELSALFEMRESNIHLMYKRIHDFPFEEELMGLVGSGVSGEQALSTTIELAKEEIQIIVDRVEESFERQTELIRFIVQEYEEFKPSCDISHEARGNSLISKLQDALDDIDDFADHLKEGRDFYHVVVPKLQRLKVQVEDVSARLTIERIEFEDRNTLSRQEAEDARMAASFAELQHPPNDSSNGRLAAATNPSSLVAQSTSSLTFNETSACNSSNGSTGSQTRTDILYQPGVEQVDHTEPVIRVDDSKVAALVAMDFDPERVVAALRLYDNNMEQALNELLSG